MTIVRQRYGGFTLLEVLIAMAILALLGSALAKQTASSAQVYSQIDKKAEALSLAENAIVQLQFSGWPGLGRTSNVLEASGQEWTVEMHVSASERADMRKLTVSVHAGGLQQGGGNRSPLVQLQAFSGRY